MLSIEETSQKAEASLLPAIAKHIESEEFSPERDGLDFLEAKNSLLLSYLIDLVVYIRDKNRGRDMDEENMRRLTEMKTVIDKMHGLNKKLRYQIDKLLSSTTSASTFATADVGNDNNGPEDPLLFRPDRKSLENGDSDDDDDEEGPSVSDSDEEVDDEDDGSDEDEDDDDEQSDSDIAATRANISMESRNNTSNQAEDDGVYRAPRHMAVPYSLDRESKEKEKEKRLKRRLRATELAQTLRAQYGDAPEQDDLHGGSSYGKQRAEARRLAEREAERTRYEEQTMIRLTTSRQEKKERRRLMRQESSNLAAISDLGNLVTDAQTFGRGEVDRDDPTPDFPTDRSMSDTQQRYENGKRRRTPEDYDGQSQHRRGKPGKAKNSLQAALYGTGGAGQRKKKKNKR